MKPTIDDLITYERRRFESAYHERDRNRCSRKDFLDGWLSSLVENRVRSAFRPERWEALFEGQE